MQKDPLCRSREKCMDGQTDRWDGWRDKQTERQKD